MWKEGGLCIRLQALAGERNAGGCLPLQRLQGVAHTARAGGGRQVLLFGLAIQQKEEIPQDQQNPRGDLFLVDPPFSNVAGGSADQGHRGRRLWGVHMHFQKTEHQQLASALGIFFACGEEQDL
jgi:hypothetical protein